MLTVSDRRRALRAFKQRGIIVHVGALEQLHAAYEKIDSGTFSDFLEKAFELLSRPDGASDGILTKALARSIGSRLQRDNFRNDGDVTASLDVIDVFTVPQWKPNPTASQGSSIGAKLQAPNKPLVDAPASSKSNMFRLRYELMLSKTLRNERFKPPLSGVSAVSKKSTYFELTGVESLRAGQNEKLVLGMLTQLEENSWFLEDTNGAIRLDLSQVSTTAGFHTDGSFVIAQGVLHEEESSDPIFMVSAMGTPPLEEREQTIDVLGKDANLFGGQFDLFHTETLLELEKAAVDSIFLFLSDVALDNSPVLAGLRHLFQGYLEDNVVPTVIVLMGSFLSHPFGQKGSDIEVLQEGFSQLGEMIKTDFPQLAESSTFVLIPSTNDAGPGNVLPRPSLPKFITRGLITALGAKNVHLATNPCRIRYMTQELVFMRDDIMQKMVRHCSIKPDFNESGLMCEHLFKTLVDQSYLCPLPLTARPLLWAHHHSLWLFPTPHVVVTADKVDGFICHYGGSLGLNPGSFSTDFSFQVYLPAERRAQQCSLDSEDVVPSNSEDDLKAQETIPEGPSTKEDMEPDIEHDQGEDVLNDVNDQQDEVPKAGLIQSDTGTEVGTEEHEEIEIDYTKNESAHRRETLDEGSVVYKSSLNAPSTGQDRSDEDVEDEESDDESLLVPAEGIKKIDIKALVKSAIAEDTSTIGQADEVGDESE